MRRSPVVSTSHPAPVEPGGSRLVRGVSLFVFYGWVIVAIGFIAQMITSISFQGLATYVVPLEREFGWSRAAIAGGRSLQQLDSVLGPVNGWLVDRFGPRLLMSAGVLVFAFAFVLFSRVESLWGYYGASILMAIANSLLGLLVVSHSLNQWFRRKRTTALGFAVLGLAAAGATFVPAIVWVQTEFGWRTSALWTALAILLLGLPIMLLMRNSPERYGLLPDGDRPGEPVAAAPGAARGGGLVDFTLGEALRTPAFWLATGGLSLAMIALAGVLVHQFAHMEAFISREAAALVLAVLNIFNMGGRILGGMLGDRVSKRALLALSSLGAAVGLVLLAVAPAEPVLLLYGAIFGFTWGVRTPVMSSILGDYFGRAAYGRILGLSLTAAAPLGIIAPVLIGLLADLQGSYQTAFLLSAAVAVGSALLFFLAKPPAPPARLRTAA